MVRIAICQAQSGIDPVANAERLVAAVNDAAAGGAAMIFTPEMSGMLDRDRERALGKARREEEDGAGKQPGKRRCFDPRVGSSDDTAFGPAGLDQAGSEGGQAVSAGEGADHRRVRAQRALDQSQGQGKIVDRVQRSDGNGEVISILAEVEPVLFNLAPAGGGGE